MGALIRKLVTVVAAARRSTFIIVFVGGLSSVATDAGYLILIPLGAAAFLSVGRHPLAGLAAAYAGVERGLRRQHPDHAARRPADRGHQRGDPPGQPRPQSIDLTANLWFSIVSTFFVAVVITFVAERIIEPRLGAYDPGRTATATVTGRHRSTTRSPRGESRGPALRAVRRCSRRASWSSLC